MLHIPALWYFDISEISPYIFRRFKFAIILPMFCIAAIFVKYCYTTVSWLLKCMSWFVLFRMLITRGKNHCEMGLLFYNSFIFPFFLQIISCKILYFAEIFPVKVPVFSQRPGRTPVLQLNVFRWLSTYTKRSLCFILRAGCSDH